jgi:hypothetical protein
MAFIQIIECHSSNVGELQKIDEQWRTATEGKRTLRRSIVAQDHNDPSHYFILAFFDSYESAVENSNLPKTTAFASRYQSFIDGPMIFQDLDVIEDLS